MKAMNTPRRGSRATTILWPGFLASRMRQTCRALGLMALWLLAPLAVADAFEDGVAAAQRGDYATAAKLWRPLADAGDARGQGALAMLYDNGQGVTKDYAAAFKWYRAAAEQELPQAQYGLGVMYEDGRGTVKDKAEAAKWYRRAANQRMAQAQYSLGLMYARGEGIARDYLQAHLWLTLALRSLNDEQARATVEKMRTLVASKMSAPQVQEAEQLAEAWTPQAAD